MEIKKETMLDDTGADNKRRELKHWQMLHYPKNTGPEYVCQLGSDRNRSLTQHTFIALLLHAKKCTKIWDCVTQQRKRLISRRSPCLGRETEHQHKVVKSYEGGECHGGGILAWTGEDWLFGRSRCPSSTLKCPCEMNCLYLQFHRWSR
uniref:Uncharacterized protein n=1 Tax=Piliocolobus tephrosceles TaxID=591936 RepID=A0A8C9I0S5_9PRIM